MLHIKSVSEIQGLPMETHYKYITKHVLVKYITCNFSLVTIVLETNGKFLLYIGDVRICMISFSEPLSSFLHSAFLIKLQPVSTSFYVLIASMTTAAWPYSSP